MKITFLLDSYKPIFDGVVRYFDAIIPVLIKFGHTVTIICPRIPGTKKIEFPIKGLKIIRCYTPGWYSMGYYFALPNLMMIKEIKNSDFVMVHSPATLGVIGGIIARLLGKKVGLFAHQDERIVLMNMLGRPKFVSDFVVTLLSDLFYPLFIDVFFCATERFKGKLLDYKVPPHKIIYVPFAIEDTRFNPDNKDFNVRKKYDIPYDAILTIYVGRISREKNIETLLEAVDLAMDEEPKLYSLFVGKKTDNEIFLKERKNSDRIIFTDFVSDEDLPSYYASADIFTSPSLHESSCFSVFEAMACQLPVITSNYRHDKDIIHKENALLVKDLLNPEVIKKHILLLARDEKLRKTIGINGKNLISNRTWNDHAKKMLKSIQSVF
ncbi:MAG: glycosyltransferase family 4 protein [Asgard group archaeon]|nr:glycosyltransferase family 4 protein [Asgard group archaeon]